MNKIVWYIVGASVGGFVGYKLADILIPETEFDYGVSDAPPDQLQATEEEEPEVEPKPEELPKKEVSLLENTKTKNVDYSSVFIPGPYVQKRRLKEIVSEYEAEQISPEENPEIITFQEYIAPGNQHEKLTLTYYEKDDVLASEEEKPIAKPEELLGPDALVKFGTRSDDPEIVYIRNNSLGQDFEVIRDRGSYSEKVLGIKEEPEEAPVDKKKKRKAARPKDDEDSD